MSLREKIKAIHDQYSGIGDDEDMMWGEIIAMCMEESVEAIKNLQKKYEYTMRGHPLHYRYIEAINDIKERQ